MVQLGTPNRYCSPPFEITRTETRNYIKIQIISFDYKNDEKKNKRLMTKSLNQDLHAYKLSEILTNNILVLQAWRKE